MPLKSAESTFLKSAFIGIKKVISKVLLFMIFTLISFPLFTTFNEFLTKIVEKLGIYTFLSKNVVPFETRAVSFVLRFFRINSRPTNTFLYIGELGEETAVFFSWNCLGWQSVVLLILTASIGLSGHFNLIHKVETLAFGVCGTFLVNLLRITAVILVNYHFGSVAGRIFHDYVGILLTMFWFVFFWWFSYKYILEEKIVKT